jgi:hypothetical protein
MFEGYYADMHKLIISGQYWTSSSPPQYLVKVLYQQLVLDHNDPAADCHVKGVVKWGIGNVAGRERSHPHLHGGGGGCRKFRYKEKDFLIQSQLEPGPGIQPFKQQDQSTC